MQDTLESLTPTCICHLSSVGTSAHTQPSRLSLTQTHPPLQKQPLSRGNKSTWKTQEHTDQLPAPPCRDHILGKIPGRLCQACTQLSTSPGRHFGTTPCSFVSCNPAAQITGMPFTVKQELLLLLLWQHQRLMGNMLVKCIPVLNPLVCIKGPRERLGYF